ncbi:hypothetical protein Tco_0073815 [Tanacetum coccineum]
MFIVERACKQIIMGSCNNHRLAMHISERACKQIRCPRSETSAERRVPFQYAHLGNCTYLYRHCEAMSFAIILQGIRFSMHYQVVLGCSVPWSNERPLENKELNAIIGACLEVFDGEINLAFDENLISNEFAVKLCLDYEVKKGKRLVKKDLIVALKGDLYFVRFIINPEEDDFIPGVILGRSFRRLSCGIVDFGNGVITIYPKLDPFEDDSEKTEKSSDDWDQLLNFNFDDVPKFGEELSSFICKIWKSNPGRHLTQEEAAKEELAIRISQIYALLEEERHKDKVELDGKTVKEDKEAVKRIKDIGSDINTMPYRIFETIGREDMKKVDRGITMIDHTQAEAMGKLSNVLCQVGVTTIIAKFIILDIPIDHDAPIVVVRGFLPESDTDDEEEYVIKRNKFGAPIYGPTPALYLNCANPKERSSAIQAITNPFRKISVWKKAVSFLGSLHDVLNRMDYDGEIDDMLRIRVREAELEEEIFTSVAWIRAFNINEPIYVKLCHEFYSTYEFDEVCADDELQSKKIIKFRLGGRAHSLTLLEFARRLGLYQAIELEDDGFNVYFRGGLRSDDNFNATNYWLSISREENLSLSRSHTSTTRNPILRVIHKMITYGLCQRTTGYDKVQKNDLWLLSMFDARHQNGYANVAWFISKLARKCRVLTEDVVRSLSALIYCKDLDTTTLRDLIDSDGKLILEDPQPGVPRVGIPRPPRASMQDLDDRMGRMEIRQDAIERMEYRQSYHWDRYHGVFEHMAGVYSVPLQGAYNPPGYAQPQYDQYYQQYPPPPPQYQPQQQQDDDE